MPKANGVIVTDMRKRQGFLAHTSSTIMAFLFCRKQAEAGIEDFDEEFRSSVTQVHVTTLDEVVSVNSSFCVAVFIGLAFNPNPGASGLLGPNSSCQAGLDTYRYLLVFEVLAFSCFLFSSLIAHGIKLYIVLGNTQDRENVKSASVNNRLLRLGILMAAMGSAIGSIFLTFSLVNIVQIKLGSFTCGSVWTHRTTIPLVVLVSSGVCSALENFGSMCLAWLLGVTVALRLATTVATTSWFDLLAICRSTSFRKSLRFEKLPDGTSPDPLIV